MQHNICIPLKGCGSHPNGTWELVGRVGDPGAYGEIWAACCVRECVYVLKYQRYGKIVSSSGEYSGTVNPENVDHEVAIQKEMAKNGLASDVVDWWHCYENRSSTPKSRGEKIGGAIVMGALKETVASLLYRYEDETVREKILWECLEILKDMHALGYYHGDLHLKNIMVNYEVARKDLVVSRLDAITEMEAFDLMKYRFYFIDFGLSGKLNGTPLENNTRIIADYNSLIGRFIEIVGEDENLMNRIREKINPTLRKYKLTFR